MPDLFAQFPRALATQARLTSLGPSNIPALLAHPDWSTRVPIVIWFHGRTANKELDPGRYLRWIRAGFAACAIDLPGHGERFDAAFQTPDHTLDIIETGSREIDEIIDALNAPEYASVFDTSRMGIGGMSAGGMVTLARLCEPHPFLCSSVEATTGFLSALYFPHKHGIPADRDPGADSDRFRTESLDDRFRIDRLDPIDHLENWRPIPLLAIHSESDKIVPFIGMSRFLRALRDRYEAVGADATLVQDLTWPSTGAPEEHIGFGIKSNYAKNVQAEFFRKNLSAAPIPPVDQPEPGL